MEGVYHDDQPEEFNGEIYKRWKVPLWNGTDIRSSFPMDPLSLTANIITVLQAANSIVSVCYEFRAALQRAPWSLTRVVDEIKDLRNVLESLEQMSEKLGESGNDDAHRLRAFQMLCEPKTGPLACCQQEMVVLERKILGANGIAKPFSKRRAFMQVVTWQLEEHDAKQCLERIHRCKSTIQLALNADEAALMLDIRGMTAALTETAEKIDSDVSRLLTRIQTCDDDESAKAITKWLSPVTPWDNHETASSSLTPGTCDWILKSDTFQAWHSSDRSFLWLSGFPGSGKTVLFSNIVASLQAHYDTSEDVCFAFFYCDFRNRDTQSATNVIGALVSQICSQVGVSAELENAFGSSKSRNTPEKRPSYSLLRDVLVSLTRSRRILLLVDAVDECEDRKNLLDFMVAIKEASEHLGNISILLTARNDADIVEKLVSFDRIRLENRKEELSQDIGLYVKTRLDKDERLHWLKENVKNDIQISLGSTSAGMFRLVQCTLDAISTLRTVRSIRLALKQLPHGLAQMYEAILVKVPPADVVLVRRILLWLSFSVLPLTLDELHTAVAIEQGLEELDEDACLGSAQDILHMCGSLVDVSDTGHIRLAHLSVRDYLLSSEMHQGAASAFALDLESGNRELALDCFTYLSFRDFQSGPCETADAFTTRLNTHPFLRHASTAWTYYLRKTDATTQLDDQILGFFSEKRRSAFMAWVQVLNAPSNFKWDLYPRHAASLYYASSFGLDAVVERLLEEGADKDLPGSRFGGTALHGAVLRCHVPVIKRLLRAGAAPSRADFNGVTPLHTAAANGHAGPIELLLEYGASVTVKDRGGETPMNWAVNAGQKISQELLTGASAPLEKDVEKVDQVYTGYVNYFPSGWYEHRSGLESSIVISVSVNGAVVTA